jgi:hypothetical protein
LPVASPQDRNGYLACECNIIIFTIGGRHSLLQVGVGRIRGIESAIAHFHQTAIDPTVLTISSKRQETLPS